MSLPSLGPEQLNQLRADHSDEIFRLRRDMRQLEKDNKSLQAELDALRLQLGDDASEELVGPVQRSFLADEEEKPSMVRAFSLCLERCVSFQPAKVPPEKLVGMLVSVNEELVRIGGSSR